MRYLVLLFCLFCSAASAEPAMTFKYVGNGGNCDNCEWVAAQGEITPDTPRDFEKFAKSVQRVGMVRLNSLGGDLNAGLELGRLFRKYNAGVTVGQTIPSTDPYQGPRGSSEVRDSGQCLSACAYAFLGGVKKELPDAAKLGFHQFRSAKSDEASGLEQLVETSEDQARTGAILTYLLEMGIGPEIYTMAASMRPGEGMYFVDAKMARQLNIDNASKNAGPWKVVAFGDGLAAEADFDNADTGILYYCKKNGDVFLSYFTKQDAKDHRTIRAWAEDVAKPYWELEKSFLSSSFQTERSQSAWKFGIVIGSQTVPVELLIDYDEAGKRVMRTLKLPKGFQEAPFQARSVGDKLTFYPGSRANQGLYTRFEIDSIIGDRAIPQNVLRMCL